MAADGGVPGTTDGEVAERNMTIATVEATELVFAVGDAGLCSSSRGDKGYAVTAKKLRDFATADKKDEDLQLQLG